MKKPNDWDEYYKNTPLEKIPWQRTGDDYLKEIINSRTVKPGSALDLGCGTGVKSIFLARKGFKVTGVDISKKAIDYAKENAKEAGVEVKFFAADATDLSFLGDEKFDFILDWANLHGIPEDNRGKYLLEITKHTKSGSKLLLRCFGRKPDEESFVVRPMGRIYLFSKKDIERLYEKYFKILKINDASKPTSDNAPGKFFYEFLMERIK